MRHNAWFFLLLLMGIFASHYAQAETKVLGRVGDFTVIKEGDPWEDKVKVFAYTEYKGGFMDGANLVITCDGNTPGMWVMADFIVGVPELETWVKVKYRIGKLKPEEADWAIAGKGDLFFPMPGLAINILGTIIKRHSYRLLVGVEDGLGEFHTLEFGVNGIRELYKYLPCLDPNSWN